MSARRKAQQPPAHWPLLALCGTVAFIGLLLLIRETSALHAEFTGEGVTGNFINIARIVITASGWIALYFIPYYVASATRFATLYYFLNLALGWTIIGWIFLLGSAIQLRKSEQP